MTSKKSSLPPYLQNLPAGISVRKLKDGSLAFTIKTDLALITCKYDPRHVEARLEERVADLFEKARTGISPNPGAGVPDFVISSDSNVKELVEIKGKNVRKFGDIQYSKLKLEEESERYVEHALELFLLSFHIELRESPSVFLIKMLAVTIANLQRQSGILRTEEGGTKLIEEIYEELLKDFKRNRETSPVGRPQLWPKNKSPAEFLKVYTQAHRDLKDVVKILKDTRQSGGDPIARIAQIYPDVPMTIVRALEPAAKRKGDPTVKDYARELAALRFKVPNGPHLNVVLSGARRHA